MTIDKYLEYLEIEQHEFEKMIENLRKRLGLK